MDELGRDEESDVDGNKEDRVVENTRRPAKLKHSATDIIFVKSPSQSTEPGAAQCTTCDSNQTRSINLSRLFHPLHHPDRYLHTALGARL